MRFYRLLAIAALLATSLLAPGIASAQVNARTQIVSIPSTTASDEAVLNGTAMNARPVTLGGVLKIPLAPAGPRPAVVIVESSAGLNAAIDWWVEAFNAAGIATLTIDSFTARGIVSTTSDQSQLSYYTMIVDAYRALGVLARIPQIDNRRISIMGSSRGAVAAIFSALTRLREYYAPPDVAFAAHIGIYSACYTRLLNDTQVADRPIRLYHGTADDYDPIQPCRDYVQRLRAAGADASLTEFPGAPHAYDFFWLRQPFEASTAQTMRRCALAEDAAHQIVDAKTGRVFTYTDSCVEHGPHIAYDRAAAEGTRASILQLLGSMPPTTVR